ncbi:hypothetical protein C5167_047977 [Papaver somniferum]|uniref:Uncharacterized protein n=1 Tax=Papaver somniferum TaxID=3469 RepID=A0A4Y7KI01_PAPSO|nr:hypothetical protein C5167_047977 [Papaver somniferum]
MAGLPHRDDSDNKVTVESEEQQKYILRKSNKRGSQVPQHFLGIYFHSRCDSLYKEPCDH